MARRTTHLALVVLTVLVATGPSALALADAAGGAVSSDSGVAAAAGPIDESIEDDATDDGLTDDATVENETVDAETNDTTGTVTNGTVTNTTDVDATAENVTDETITVETSTNVSDGGATDLDADGTDATTGVVESDASTSSEDADVRVVSFGAPISSLLSDPVDGVDATDEDGGTAGDTDDFDAATTERDDPTGNATTTAGAGGAASTASGPDSDRSPDRDHPDGPASSTEAVVGVGALTAAVLFPQLADGLALAGDAGALSAASSAAASSRSSVVIREEFDRLWRFATAFRYSRYDDSDPLAHETRARLHETVERSPGASLSAVSERADVAVSTARHHLDVLEAEGLVTTAKIRGKRRYFPAHSDDVELAAALEDEGAAEVLRALARLGDAHGGRLADELDRDPSTVSHHLSRLEDAGLVEREREGRAVVNRVVPDVRRALREGGEIGEEAEIDAGTPATAD